jgi:hypothetical protein
MKYQEYPTLLHQANLLKNARIGDGNSGTMPMLAVSDMWNSVYPRAWHTFN